MGGLLTLRRSPEYLRGDNQLFSAHSEPRPFRISSYVMSKLATSQIIKEFGYSPINSQGLTVGPYLVGWAMVWGQAWHSDKTRDRGYHIMASSIITFVGYVILATQAEKSHHVSYFACYLVIGGAYSLFPLVM